MSEGIMYSRSTYVDRAEKRTGIGKFLIAFNILLALTIAGELLFHFAVAPTLVLKKVYVESEVPLSNEEVLRIAGITGKEYYFSLNSDTIRKNLESSPLVRKAYIEKVFPDSLKVILYGRKPLALAFAGVDGRSIPVVLDEDGIIFRAGDEAFGLNLPVLSGLPLEAAGVGTRLPAMYLPFLKELAHLKETSPELCGLISELRFMQRSDRSFDVLLYPVNHRVPVRIGSEIDAKLCTYIMMVLDVMEQEKVTGSLDEIDFRTGEVVYRTRGE